MRGASTGQDPSPQAPESAGTAPMNPSENLEASGESLRRPVRMRFPLENPSVADVVLLPRPGVHFRSEGLRRR